MMIDDNRIININGWFVVSCLLALFILTVWAWQADDSEAQVPPASFFVSMDENLNWWSMECHAENPFTVSRPMVWSDEYGLIEVNHSDGMTEPLRLVLEIDVMSLAVLYEYQGEEFLIGLQCPDYNGGFRDTHFRNPSWGAFDWYSLGRAQ